MGPFLNHVLANCAIILFVILAWTHAPFSARASGFSHQIKTGIVFGLGALAVMLRPLEIEPGIYIDLRTIPLAMAGLIGGWPGAAVAAAMTGAYRLWLGGAGALPGLVVISLTAAIGALGSVYLARRVAHYAEIGLFSAVIALGDLFVIQLLPESGSAPEIHDAAPLWIGIVFVTTFSACLAVFAELRRRVTEQRLQMYEAVIQSLPESLNVKDLAGQFVLANPATATLMRASSAEALIGKSDFDFYPASVAETLRADETAVMEKGVPLTIEQTVSWENDEPLVLSTLKSPLRDKSGNLIGLVTHNRDLTEKKQLMLALADSERRVKAALSNMADGLIMFDADLNVVLCNEQYRGMFPLTADLRVPGAQARVILEGALARGEFAGIPAERASEFIDGAMAKLRKPGVVEFPLYDGRWVESRTTPTEDGGCLVVCSDITRSKRDEQELRELNEKLEEMAMTDGLTNLLNRRAFDASLAAEMARTQKNGSCLSLLLIDVDRFKAYNDTYGHTAGDECLRQIAKAVRATARRRGDRAARYGGEEMAVILPNTSAQDALVIADELRQRVRSLDLRHEASEKSIVTISVGVAAFDPDASPKTPDQFVNQADEALYSAKAAGRDAVRGEQWLALQARKGEGI
ncbi:diguanylate cyclase [Rhizobium sp. TRM95796]|uniref:diguanylate cyclase n=1 Tax=Rhizobium sp. TRM95796 TaxID=2979862 RepID=UPI0021E71230|nr:diguanylate cyclase [Rhizobium sp. TRM95796]MCV3768720.1 diguanylate cyclase [Rhizobium sp. TRM95796]